MLDSVLHVFSTLLFFIRAPMQRRKRSRRLPRLVAARFGNSMIRTRRRSGQLCCELHLPTRLHCSLRGQCSYDVCLDRCTGLRWFARSSWQGWPRDEARVGTKFFQHWSQALYSVAEIAHCKMRKKEVIGNWKRHMSTVPRAIRPALLGWGRAVGPGSSRTKGCLEKERNWAPQLPSSIYLNLVGTEIG